MKQEAHWNKIGAGYEDEIFNVFESDITGRLKSAISKYANKDHTAIDFGCGTGRAFKYLSPGFGKILGIDISKELLAQAAMQGYPNVTLQHHDLTKPLKGSKADFGFCCNVVMLPEVDMNLTMLKNIRKSISEGGHVVIVMPSLESFLYSGSRLIEWCGKEGTTPSHIDPSELAGFRGSKLELIQGVVQIDGVKTKHYLEPELEVLFTKAGFKTLSIQKLEYDWTSEFSDPPSWMRSPYPWDWMIEAFVGN